LRVRFWRASTLLAPLGVAHAEMKIAVVNVPRLLDEAPQAKSAMQALQDEFAPRQKEIMAQQKELKAKEDKLNRDGAVMAENERATPRRTCATVSASWHASRTSTSRSEPASQRGDRQAAALAAAGSAGVRAHLQATT
jgi:outer membrane protein